MDIIISKQQALQNPFRYFIWQILDSYMKHVNLNCIFRHRYSNEELEYKTQQYADNRHFVHRNCIYKDIATFES